MSIEQKNKTMESEENNNFNQHSHWSLSKLILEVNCLLESGLKIPLLDIFRKGCFYI